MVNFNTTAICIKGTHSVQQVCNNVAGGVHSTVTSGEASTIAVVGTFLLWKIGSQISEQLQARVKRIPSYEMVATSDNEESKAAIIPPSRRVDTRDVCRRIDSVLTALVIAFLAGQLVFFYDYTRRLSNPENCDPVDAYAMQICVGILNATYHAVIPSGIGMDETL